MDQPSKLKQELLNQSLGKELIAVINKLKGKEYTSEYTLSEKLNTDINTMRHLLYELSQVNLVTSIKKKDNVKGWYIYYWKFLDKNITYFLIKRLKKQTEIYKERIEKEKENTFFSCPNHCVRLTFDEALNYNFRCPECGEMLKEEENNELINKMKEQLKETEEKIKLLEEEQELKKEEKKKIKEKKEKKKITKTSKKKISKGKEKKKKITKKTTKGKTKKKKANKKENKKKIKKKVTKKNPVKKKITDKKNKKKKTRKVKTKLVKRKKKKKKEGIFHRIIKKIRI